MPKILLVEDDANLGYILKEYLELHQFEVTLEIDGLAGGKAFEDQDFDLCILDIMMPQQDGFSLAKDIRRVDPNIPLIFLTARSLTVDKLKGFRIGADDYIVKPVEEEELLARIQAILRRSKIQKAPTEWHTPLTIGQYQFDPANHQLIWNGEIQVLTSREVEVLQFLCDHKNRLASRKLALKKLWGEQDYFSRRSMDVFISRLRKYLSKDPDIRIINVHGKGFMLCDEGE